ncbi:hypothetical protein K1T71_015278 [Dendrolimus kikuchii]|nr:hypothetical protein K1T71_015278 [Dendrolimus kikuchii]
MTTPGIPSQQLPPYLQQPADMMAISLSSRLPEFWADQPRVWFIRVESILAPQKLGDDAKFDLIVAKLPKEVVVELSDFLANPPDSGKFQALKTKLLGLYEDSKARQIEKLTGEMELGDQKPSQLLHRMKNLARDKIPDDTLRVLWQSHLPATVRAVLAVSETKGLDNLSVIADNVAEATRNAQISEIGQPSSSIKQPQDSNVIASLTAELAKINARLTSIERSRPTIRRSRSLSRRPSRSASRRRTPDSPDWLCSYHFRYRQRAHRCIPPCAWKSSESAVHTRLEN